MSVSPQASEADAAGIVERLRVAGHTAYFAGGCVRDMLLGKQPKDFDIATDATPDQVSALFSRTVQIGAHFGVVSVLIHGAPYEVASFRADGLYLDGRRPVDVRFSSPEEDAQRRDFTINGMFYCPLEHTVIDFVNGQADLQAGLLRAIGDPAQRFEEDKLRVLRAVRFAATLDFKIDPATWDAVKAAVPQICVVSPERIREELNKIFAAPQRVRGLDLLDESGLLRVLLPELAATKGCEQPPEFHPEGDVFVHTRMMLGQLAPDAPVTLVWGVLLHDIGKPPTFQVDETGRIRFNTHEHVGAVMAERRLRELRFSNDDVEAIRAMVGNHMAFKDVQQMRVAKLKRFMAREGFDKELELHRVDCLCSHGMLDNHEFLIQKEDEFANEPLIPKPLVTGQDLIELGLKPGPAFKDILAGAQTLQLEGGLDSRDAALVWLKNTVQAED